MNGPRYTVDEYLADVDQYRILRFLADAQPPRNWDHERRHEFFECKRLARRLLEHVKETKP